MSCIATSNWDNSESAMDWGIFEVIFLVEANFINDMTVTGFFMYCVTVHKVVQLFITAVAARSCSVL